MKHTFTHLSGLLLTRPAALRGADAVDLQELVSSSDLLDDRPAETPAAGQPIGERWSVIGRR